MKLAFEPIVYIAGILLVAVIVILILLPLYFSTVETSHALLENEINMYIQEGKEALNKQLEDARRIAYAYRYSSEISAICTRNDSDIRSSSSHPLFKVLNFANDMIPFNTTDAVFAMTFKMNRVLLSAKRGVTDGRIAVENGLFAYENLSFEAFRDRLFSQGERFWPAAELTTPEGGTQSVILYNQYFSYWLPSAAAFSLVLPVEDLMDRFLPHPVRGQSYLTVSSEGSVLFSSAPDSAELPDAEYAQIDGQDFRMWYASGVANGLDIRVGVATEVFDAYLAPVIRRVHRLITVAVLVAALSAVVCGWYFFLPLRPVYSLLWPSNPYNHGLTRMFRQIRLTMERQSAIQEKLDMDFRRLSDAIASSALRHAISGQPLMEEERCSLESRALLQKEYVVLLFQYDNIDYNRLRAFQAWCFMTFGEHWSETLYYLPNATVLVVPAEAMHAMDSRDSRERIVAACGQDIRFGWSHPHRGVRELTYAFMEAQRYLYQKYHPGVVEDAGNKDNSVTFRQFIQVTRLIRTGQEDALNGLFSKMKSWLILDCPSLEQANLLLRNLRQAIALAEEDEPGNAEGDAQTSPHILNSLTALQSRALRLCRAYTSAVSDPENPAAEPDISEQIVQEIRARFRDPDLCLGSLSAKFQLSESYISMLVKKQTSETYAAFVNTLRMNEAMLLLTRTDAGIDEIAGRCGFLYKNTFYKAFKKAFGYPPNAYRQSTGQGDRPATME